MTLFRPALYKLKLKRIHPCSLPKPNPPINRLPTADWTTDSTLNSDQKKSASSASPTLNFNNLGWRRESGRGTVVFHAICRGFLADFAGQLQASNAANDFSGKGFGPLIYLGR